jgi:hypothetical protein
MQSQAADAESGCRISNGRQMQFKMERRASTGWEACKEALSEGESGEIFTAAVLAFESGYEARIQMVLDVVEERPETCTGLVSALGWLSWQQAEIPAGKLLAMASLGQGQVLEFNGRCASGRFRSAPPDAPVRYPGDHARALPPT